MAPRIRAQTIGGGLGITPTSVAFYDVLSTGGTIAQMAVGGGLTGTWALINSSSSLVALSAGGLMTRGAGAATSGTPVVQFTSGSTILQVPITATVIVATLPANTVLPAISPSGTPVVGVTLTATTGTWTGDPTPTYAYQWRQVDTSTNISGATSATYTPVSGDVGHTLTCVVTATNIKGSASASAATTPAVISVPVAPVNTVAPGAPTGSANVGATLTAQNGTWTGNPSPTFTYAWLVNGVANGATGSTYVPVSGDLGSVISVRVTGTNVAGSASATSAATAAITIAPSIPSNTVAPGVPTGTPSVGNVLTAQNGTWAGYPAPTFTYQWQRNGTNISGATASTYTLVTADAGNPIRVVVTGTNASGSASANSTATTNVTMAPANTVAPTISTNTPNVGSVITCSPGTWTGYAAPTFTYQWFWADTVAPIIGATSSTYTPVSGDVGHTLSCNVTGSNSVSSASASTAATTSAVTSTPAMPAGATAIYYADQAVGNVIPNAVGSAAPAVTNLQWAPRRMFSIPEGSYWNPNNITITDKNATDWNGTANQAATMVGTGFWYLRNVAYGGGTLAAGRYTMAVWAKRAAAAGTDQQFRMAAYNTQSSGTLTATSTWQRFTWTFDWAGGSGNANLMALRSFDDSTGASLEVSDFHLFLDTGRTLGATTNPLATVFDPLATDLPNGTMYLGAYNGDPKATAASGIVDMSSAAGGGSFVQFAANQTVTTWTAMAIRQRVVDPGAVVKSYFSDQTGGGSGYSNFSPMIQGSAFMGGATKTQDDYSQLWNYQGDLGNWEFVCDTFDGATLTSTKNNQEIHTTNTSGTATFREIVFNGHSNSSGTRSKYFAWAFYPFALDASQRAAARAALVARALANPTPITTNAPRRFLAAEGHSIVQGNVGLNSYVAVNSSPAIKYGMNFARNSATLDNNSGNSLFERAAYLDGLLAQAPAGQTNILSVQIGVNDFGSYTTSAWLAKMITYLDARRAAGWKVVLESLFDSNRTGFRDWADVVNPAYATWVGTHCDAFCDYRTVAVGTRGEADSTTNFSDGTHLTTAGYAIGNPVLLAAINTIT